MPTEETRRRLVEAARTVLVEDGFAAASTRAIASRAAVNQALIFYHFGGVEPLLLAALDASSEARLAAYREAVESVDSVPALLEAIAPLFAEDVAGGHVTLVTELVGASLSRPELRKEVAARLEPWRELAEGAARRLLAGTPFEPAADDVASAAVALGLGLNLLARLDPEAARLTGLTELARALADAAG